MKSGYASVNYLKKEDSTPIVFGTVPEPSMSTLRVHEASAPREETTGQELVSDVPPSNDDQGGSTQETSRAPSSEVEAVGDQRLSDSPREAQGQSHPFAHSPVAQQDTEDHRQEVLRFRVQVRNTKTHKVEYKWIPMNMLI